uniref:Uncharacterized protein n=1 Tax=Caenorhabditis japonica TaxID=281687 RepID=A0A8R1DFS5_CAEJA
MSDDEDVQAEPIAHGDDFDFLEIFCKLSLDPPTMEEILSEAKKFGDSHRNLINKFLLEPSMSARKMNLLFAKHVTTVKFKKHPEAVMRIEATPESSRDLTKTLVKTLNKEKGTGKRILRPWRFVTSTDEKSPNEFVTMTGCAQNCSSISEASDLTKAERTLLLAIIEEMMRGDGSVKMRWIHDIVREDPCKMTGQKCDQFMTKMTRQKYFSLDADSEILEITPRILVELEPWLRAKLIGELKICELCRKIIARCVIKRYQMRSIELRDAIFFFEESF